LFGEAVTDVLITFEIVLSAPTIEAESFSPAALPAAKHDRAGVAEPDVAEWLDDYLRERRELLCALCRAVMSRNQPDLLATAAGVDGFGEGRDLALGRLQVAKP
jgi:hypothetical protein